MKKTEQCYLCRKYFAQSEMSRDHVPPKGMFPEPRPTDLITIRACKKCNHDQHRDDEFLRLFTSIVSHASPAGKQIYKEKTEPNTIGKSKLRDKVRPLIKNAREAKVVINGESQLGFYFPIPKKDVERIMTRIVRGLLFKFSPEIDPSSLIFYCDQVMTQKTLHDLLQSVGSLTTVLSRGDGVFDARYGICGDSPNTGIWILCFYEATTFTVLHTDTDHPIPSHSDTTPIAIT